MAYLATEGQVKLAIKMLNRTNHYAAKEYKQTNQTNKQQYTRER